MPETEPSGVTDPQRISETVANIAERSPKIIEGFLERYATGEHVDESLFGLKSVGSSFAEYWHNVVTDPSTIIDAQVRFWNDYTKLWSSVTQRALGQEPEAVVQPPSGDKRFSHEDWSDNLVFDFVKQSYLLASRYAFDCINDVEGLDERTAKKLEFYTRQFVDALSPTNFAVTNPEVLRETFESRGDNLLQGLHNLIEDLEQGRGKLKVKMVDVEKFELGKNVATTPGKVVFENELMQLLQYTPTTETVYQTPLLIVPPWINKFYILDLREKNSFIKWAVDEGHTVFVISWINPDETLKDKNFEDYLSGGALAALDAIEKATGEREVKAVGYCLGGTLLASMLAYLAAQGEQRIKAATFFTTMLDFSEPGELEIFTDDETISWLEEQMAGKGYLDGSSMAQVFNMLRANDLIWSFVVNNYLMGKEPFPFDLLYWNSDSTRMPQAMHSYYLRNMYQNNLLCKPGGIELVGVPIDLSQVTVPVYFLSTKEDHIAPWTSTYAGTRLFGGPVRFVLGMSGHIAGVINPPSGGKYGYYTNSELATDPAKWLADAGEHQGSWWVDWREWVAEFNGDQVDAREPGAGRLKVIEDAPGRYVKVRIS